MQLDAAAGTVWSPSPRADLRIPARMRPDPAAAPARSRRVVPGRTAEAVSPPSPGSPIRTNGRPRAQMGARNDMIGTDTISRVIGKDVYDQSGDKIGSASEVYLDDESGQPEWVTVRTGLFGTKETFVPIRDANLTDDGVRVPVSKAKVKDAPRIDTDGHLSPEEEQQLYRYYGLGSGNGGRAGMNTGMNTGMETSRTDM